MACVGAVAKTAVGLAGLDGALRVNPPHGKPLE